MNLNTPLKNMIILDKLSHLNKECQSFKYYSFPFVLGSAATYRTEGEEDETNQEKSSNLDVTTNRKFAVEWKVQSQDNQFCL